MSKYSKLFGALLGLVTPSGLVGIATVYGIGLTDAQAVSILSAVAVLGTLIGVYVAPANKATVPQPAQPAPTSVDLSVPVAPPTNVSV